MGTTIVALILAAIVGLTVLNLLKKRRQESLPVDAAVNTVRLAAINKPF